MKYGQMVCAESTNIGDDIQSVAAERFLPRVDTCLDREHLDEVAGEMPIALLMNGWFMHMSNWPPAPCVQPVFVSFHVREGSKPIIAKHADYLKQFAPIGVRDNGTAEFLKSLGVPAEVTYCLTLTFPRREAEPENGRVFIVDGGELSIPRSLRRKSVRFSHVICGMRDETKLQYARELIEYYRDHARLVITTRLHCALPCMAMGIPVVFFGKPSDYRTRIVRDMGGVIYNRKLHSKWLFGGLLGRLLDPVDWRPESVDVSQTRDRLIDKVREKLQRIAQAETFS